MPTPEEPGEQTASTTRDTESGEVEVLSLVDYFDKIDRDAFRRALEHRDSYYPVTSRS